ncbi:MAG: hypothetical protein ABIH03_00960 [Pseudomonadota bacterium]
MKRVKVSLRDGTGRVLYYGGTELAAIQDSIGKTAIELFWEISAVSDSGSDESRSRNMMKIIGDKELLVLLHAGIRGGGGKSFSRDDVGRLMHTTIKEKSAYISAIVDALSIALFGKDQAELVAEAAEKQDPQDEESATCEDAGEADLPNPT